MQNAKFDEPLEKYLEAITLTASQAQQIEKALQGILALALTAFPDATVYAQGSYASDTMAKPLTNHQGGGVAGEFDIDIAFERDAWGGAVEALNAIADAVKDDDTFGQLTIDNTKNSCVRVEYPEDNTGVAFHIDLVPTALNGTIRSVPDRGNDEWKSSDAKQFAEWFNAKATAQPGMRQVAVILKHLRDRADLTDAIKSIFILTIVTRTHYNSGSIMGDLLSVLDGIAGILSDESSAPRIENPVNTGEDLAAHVTDYSAVRDFFLGTKTKLVKAISADDATALKELFGLGFSYAAAEKFDYNATATPIIAPARAFGDTDEEADS